MKKFIPNMTDIVKGILITAIALIVIRFMPASIKGYIYGTQA